MAAQEPVRVQVDLDVLESVLRSAVTSAVRHALTGLPDSTRGVLVSRAGEIEGLTVGRVVASLAAGGRLSRKSFSDSTTTEGA